VTNGLVFKPVIVRIPDVSDAMSDREDSSYREVSMGGSRNATTRQEWIARGTFGVTRTRQNIEGIPNHT